MSSFNDENSSPLLPLARFFLILRFGASAFVRKTQDQINDALFHMSSCNAIGIFDYIPDDDFSKSFRQLIDLLKCHLNVFLLIQIAIIDLFI